MSFKGKVVLVTGASSGIGAATAIAFAAEGAQVAIVGRNSTKLASVAQRCEQRGSAPLVLVGDVTASEDNRRVVHDTVARLGRLDVLVNNAGLYVAAGILDPRAMEVHDRTMATNLQAAVQITHLAATHLIQTRGNIINISSIGAINITAENSFSYLTSKAALNHFTRAIALELAPKGVRVNAVNPGVVRTDFLGTAGIPMEQWDAAFEGMAQHTPLKRVAEPEEIADLILFLVSDRARSITGSTHVIDNGGLIMEV